MSNRYFLEYSLYHLSIIGLILPGTITNAITQACIVLLFLFSQKSNSTLILIYSIFIFLFLLQSLYFMDLPSLSSFIKILNIGIFMMLQNLSIDRFMRVLRFYLSISWVVYFICYFSSTNLGFVNVYNNIIVYNRNVNSGIFFELNYFGILTSVAIIYYFRGILFYLAAATTLVFTTFRVSASLLVLGLSLPKLVRTLTFWGYFCVPIILYLVYLNIPIILDVRYFITKAIFEHYQFQEYYTTEQITAVLESGMYDSPWGFMTTSHSGVLDTLLLLGPVFIILHIFLSIRAYMLSPYPLFNIAVFLYVCSFFMSQSLGGITAVSLLTTLILSRDRFERI